MVIGVPEQGSSSVLTDEEQRLLHRPDAQVTLVAQDQHVAKASELYDAIAPQMLAEAIAVMPPKARKKVLNALKRVGRLVSEHAPAQLPFESGSRDDEFLDEAAEARRPALELIVSGASEAGSATETTDVPPAEPELVEEPLAEEVCETEDLVEEPIADDVEPEQAMPEHAEAADENESEPESPTVKSADEIADETIESESQEADKASGVTESQILADEDITESVQGIFRKKGIDYEGFDGEKLAHLQKRVLFYWQGGELPVVMPFGVDEAVAFVTALYFSKHDPEDEENISDQVYAQRFSRLLEGLSYADIAAAETELTGMKVEASTIGVYRAQPGPRFVANFLRDVSLGMIDVPEKVVDKSTDTQTATEETPPEETEIAEAIDAADAAPERAEVESIALETQVDTDAEPEEEAGAAVPEPPVILVRTVAPVAVRHQEILRAPLRPQRAELPVSLPSEQEALRDKTTPQYVLATTFAKLVSLDPQQTAAFAELIANNVDEVVMTERKLEACRAIIGELVGLKISSVRKLQGMDINDAQRLGRLLGVGIGELAGSTSVGMPQSVAEQISVAHMVNGTPKDVVANQLYRSLRDLVSIIEKKRISKVPSARLASQVPPQKASGTTSGAEEKGEQPNLGGLVPHDSETAELLLMEMLDDKNERHRDGSLDDKDLADAYNISEHMVRSITKSLERSGDLKQNMRAPKPRTRQGGRPTWHWKPAGVAVIKSALNNYVTQQSK